MRALVGLEGSRLQESEREALARFSIPGVLLLRHNVRDAPTLRALCAEVHDVVREGRGHDAIIAVDEEGGAVSPLAPAIGSSPSAAACGVANEPRLTEDIHRWRAARAREHGVNLLLAPVLDVDRPNNPVIATRAFGRDPSRVIAHARAAVAGLRRGGVRNCVKHWPGHGPVSVDSHIDLPRLELSRERWENVDLPPFAALLADDGSAARPDAVMVAHVVAEFLDPSRTPATVSSPLVRGWLREQWRWSGAILSDALEMGAFRDQSPADALQAGCDLVLLATPLARLRNEITDLLVRARNDDGEAEARIRRLAEAVEPEAGEIARANWEVRSLQERGPEPRRSTAPSWVVVDAASHDRLVRPPEGFDPSQPEDPREPLGLVAAEFEEELGPALAECRLAHLDETPGEALDGISPDWCVVASVRPLPPALRRWLAIWLRARPDCAVALLGAAALEVEEALAPSLDGRKVLWCPDFHAEARHAVARRMGRGSY